MVAPGHLDLDLGPLGQHLGPDPPPVLPVLGDAVLDELREGVRGGAGAREKQGWPVGWGRVGAQRGEERDGKRDRGRRGGR